MRHIRPWERKLSPVTDPSDDPLTRKRDEWKARIRTEGDSKASSASIASSTCRKAGARGKHTRNVLTTPGRGREESRTGTSQPSRRMNEPARLCLQCREKNFRSMHKASRVLRRRRPPLPKEGKTGDKPYPCVNPPPQRKTAVASPKAREIAITRRSGPDHAEVPPMKE